MEAVIEWCEEYWDRIKENPLNLIIAAVISCLLVKPMFQLSIFSGFLYVGTLIWLFGWKVELFVESPGYSVMVYALLAIRWAIGPLGRDSIRFLGKGDLVTAGIYAVVWGMVYIKTREIQRH